MPKKGKKGKKGSKKSKKGKGEKSEESEEKSSKSEPDKAKDEDPCAALLKMEAGCSGACGLGPAPCGMSMGCGMPPMMSQSQGCSSDRLTTRLLAMMAQDPFFFDRGRSDRRSDGWYDKWDGPLAQKSDDTQTEKSKSDDTQDGKKDKKGKKGSKESSKAGSKGSKKKKKK